MITFLLSLLFIEKCGRLLKLMLTFLRVRLCCVQLAILFTTHYGFSQWLFFVEIKSTPLTLPLLILEKRWFGSSFYYSPLSILFEAHARFLDLLKTCAATMKRPGYSNMEVTNERSGCSYDVEITMTRILILMTWC